jgi:hypothetical protein
MLVAEGRMTAALMVAYRQPGQGSVRHFQTVLGSTAVRPLSLSRL